MPNALAHDAGLDGLPIPQRVFAALAILAGVLMGALDASIVNVALPTIASDLGVSASSVIWVANAYHVASAATMMSFAAFGSVVGRKRVYVAGLAVFTLTSLGCAMAQSLAWLVAFRAAQGLCYAAMVSIGIGMYRRIYPAHLLGSILGINALVVAGGTVAGPTVGGVIVTTMHWPWLFLINLPLGVLAISLAWRNLPADHEAGGAFDAKGAVLSTVALVALVMAVDQVGRWPAEVIGVLAAVSLLAGALFYRSQRRVPAPLLPLGIFASSRFSLAAVTSLASFTAQGLAFVALPFLFQATYGRSAIASALLFTPWPLTVVFAAPLAGRLADRFNGTIVSTIGTAIFGMGLASTALLGTQPTTQDILWRLALCGLGFGLFQAPNNREMLSSVAASLSGTASGILSTARVLGQSLGAALVAVMMAAIATPTQRLGWDGDTVVHGALWLATAIAACSSLFSVLRIRR
ncbi:MFS transporter [Ralstonia holmesii]|uniref:Riboflavin transporter RibZ n=1 Tax=Ralstonia holmesii TaxID=3058602 RepID=A0ABC8QJ19_9RALS|nr:MFS transporter [Ralstonia sp. LMG 32967]CAJ0796785.1 Riboflavin transporter RibZ [Ralstonia sp. LMG 32967]CAJ0805843.1 Riboflavin transporter RibZ [Ralstonia sp. LMG 32967]